MEHRRLVPLQSGLPVTLRLSLGWGVYFIRGLIAGRRFFPVPLLLLTGLDEPQKVENRQAPRASVHINPLESQMGLSDARIPIDIVILNISTGGILFRHAEPLPQGLMVKTCFKLPGDLDPVAAISQVVRAESKKTHRGAIHQMGASFLSLDDSGEDRIFKFVFDQQIQMRKKGLMGR